MDVKILKENENVRVRTDDENVLFQNQDIEQIELLIKSNLATVFKHYQQKSNPSIPDEDILEVGLKIVLHFLYLYNQWIVKYDKIKNIDLKFHVEDFENPSTHDIIFKFFKTRRADWKNICAHLFGMSMEEVSKYYNQRKLFYEK